MDKVAKATTGKLPFRIKFGYGAAEGAGTNLWIIFYLFFMFFLTDMVKMKPGTAGLMLGIATLWDAVCGLAVGVISDRSKSRWGRRRPFILGSAVPFCLVFWLLFSDLGFNAELTMIYFISMIILFWTAFACLNIPYTALAGEMTQDYDDRMSLVSYRMGWGQVLGIAGASLPLILASYYGNIFGSTRMGWSMMAATFGLVSVFPILWTWRITKGYELFPEQSEFDIKEILKAIVGNRPFRYTLVVWTFSIVATNVLGAVLVYFMKYQMRFSEEKSAVGFFVLMTVGLFFIPVINHTSSKLGKRWAFIIFATTWALAGGGGMIWVGPRTEIWFWVWLGIISIGPALTYLMGWSMIPDVVEVDEFKTGQRREGMYFAIAASIQKGGSAIALWSIGLVLTWVGYAPDVTQTAKAIWGIRILCCEVPVVLLIVAMIAAYFLPLTREKHQALCEIIKQQKQGKECDLTRVEDII